MSSLHKKIGITLLIGLIALVDVTSPARAESAASLVGEGNELLAKGAYEEALAAYEKASVDAPESAEVHFNKGLVAYRQENFNEAAKLFEKAALITRDLSLEAQAKFNQGNALFGESVRQQESDPKKSVEALKESIEHFKLALERDKDFLDAAHNIEVARLTMKTILDEQHKKEQEAKDRAAKQQERLEKARALEERQNALNADTLKRSQARPDGDASASEETNSTPDTQEGAAAAGETASPNPDHNPGYSPDYEDLRDRQKELSNDSQAFADELSAEQQQSPELATASEALKRASAAQSKAHNELEEGSIDAAKPEQENALNDLKEAVKALSGGDKDGESGDQSNQNEQSESQESQEDGQQEQQQGQEKSESEKQREQPEQQAGENEQQKAEGSKSEEGEQEQQQSEEDQASLASARGILDEEKDEKERRQIPQSGGGNRPVERDW